MSPEDCFESSLAAADGHGSADRARLRCAIRCSPDSGQLALRRVAGTRAKSASERGAPAFHVEPGRGYARGSEVPPGLGSIKAHNPSELVMSRRHCTKHPELETALHVAPACGRGGMLDKEARLKHPMARLWLINPNTRQSSVMKDG